MKKGDSAGFVEQDARWRKLSQVIREVRVAFADVSPTELRQQIDEAVEEVRAGRYCERLRSTHRLGRQRLRRNPLD